jgi:hypothetical protein
MLTGHRKVSGRRVGDSAVMQTTTTYSSPVGVDPQPLERRIAEMYRDVANELAEDLHFPTGCRLARLRATRAYEHLAHVALGEETPLH